MRSAWLLVGMAACGGTPATPRSAPPARSSVPLDAPVDAPEAITAGSPEVDCAAVAAADKCADVSFGFGRGGYGPGGCPTGWGPIPTRRDGDPQPSVTLAPLAPSLSASDRHVIERSVEAERGNLENCLRFALQRNAKLAGTVTIRVCVDHDQKRFAVASGIGDSELELCLAHNLRDLPITPPSAGAAVGIAIPLDLRAAP